MRNTLMAALTIALIGLGIGQLLTATLRSATTQIVYQR